MIFKYFKYRKGYIFLFILISLIFSAFSFLYGLHFDGVVYALCICTLIYIILAIIDYTIFKNKHIDLNVINKNVPDFIKMNQPKNLIEQDYQDIINSFYESLNQFTTKSNLSYKDMTEFYALWVHQIKTPISAISIILQKDNSENSKVLQSELFKIQRYTDIVLNYIRLEDISLDLSFCKISLENIVKPVIKKFAPVFISKNITINLENLKSDVLTDEKWLSFALEQIISNSLKYTQSGGNINISYQNNGMLIIKDNGIGISPEDLPRIFEKGFTGYNGRMDKKATGIGLYLAKKTLNKLEHTIKISSDESSGTTVEIDLSRNNTVHE